MTVWSKQVDEIIDRALLEDAGAGDITTSSLIPATMRSKACLLAKEDGVLAGIDVARRTFQRMDPDISFEARLQDGAIVGTSTVLANIEGRTASLLTAERVALNLLQRLSGIATETARYVDAVKGCKACITDTRKTTPGIRFLEKYAVRIGGGCNHRANLGDGVLIKDNHLAALMAAGEDMHEIVDEARRRIPHTLKIEVEVTSVAQALEALKAGADIIMLDNMDVAEMRRAVRAIKGRAVIEASGGITLETVRAVAETGVDYISVGALTHSARSLDISLEFEQPPPVQRASSNSSKLERIRAALAEFPPPNKASKGGPAIHVDPEIDLHRYNVDEAMARLDDYIYEAYASGLGSVRVIHGKGTGVLRQAVRQELPRNPLVKSVRSGEKSEGGDGATIVELADW